MRGRVNTFDHDARASRRVVHGPAERAGSGRGHLAANALRSLASRWRYGGGDVVVAAQIAGNSAAVRLTRRIGSFIGGKRWLAARRSPAHDLAQPRAELRRHDACNTGVRRRSSSMRATCFASGPADAF